MKKIYNLKFIATIASFLGGLSSVNAQCSAPPVPVVSNPTICVGNQATLSATGASSLITGWYQNSFGGNAVGTGSTYVTPSLTTTTVYYAAQLSPTTTESLVMPPHSSVFGGSVRGYWFIAPTDFMITGVMVPTEASSGSQNIAILKLPTTPPVFSATTSVFDVLYLTQNDATTGTISVNIPVYSGDVIGVLGNRADQNSYAPVSPYTSYLGTYSLTLTRFGMQYALSSNPPQAVWTETTSSASISRVNIYTTLGCLNALTPGTVTVDSCATGIKGLAENAIRLYPNPSKGNLHVDLGDYSGSQLTIEIFDVLGKSVFITEIVNSSSVFDISYLSSGIYTYKLNNKRSAVKVGRLVKE